MTRRIAKPSHSLIALRDVDVELVRMEMNLTAIGFFSAGDARGKERELGNDISRKRIEKFDARRGILTSVEFESTLGLPGVACLDKWGAFCQIAQEQRKITGVLTNPIRFTAGEMIKILQVTPCGDVYADIGRWGSRMLRTTIIAVQMIYLASKKEWVSMETHAFRNFFLKVKDQSVGNAASDVYHVELEEWLLDNFNAGYSIPMNYAVYLTLTRPIAKGIFGLLHIWFYASKGNKVEKDYVELCQHLSVATYDYVSKIRDTMGRSLDELVAIGYLAAWEIQRMVGKQGFKVVMLPGRDLMKGMSAPKPGLLAESGKLLGEGIVQALIEQGITASRAVAFATTYPESFLQDHLTSHAETMRRDRGAIRSPAAVLAKAISSGQSVPAPAPMKIIEGKTEQARDPHETQKHNYAEWIENEADRAVHARYEPEALRHKLQQLFEEHSKGPAGAQVRKIPVGNRGKVMLAQLRKLTTREMALPTFDKWLETQKQGQLHF